MSPVQPCGTNAPLQNTDALIQECHQKGRHTPGCQERRSVIFLGRMPVSCLFAVFSVSAFKHFERTQQCYAGTQIKGGYLRQIWPVGLRVQVWLHRI